MKKSPVLVILLSMLIFSLMQSCKKPTQSGESVPDEKVFIYLKSIIHNGEYHLMMTDSKDNTAIDTLTTDFIKVEGELGKIFWKKDDDNGIKKITAIEPKYPEPVIFEDGAHKKLFDGWKLRLLKKLSIGPDGKPIREEYFIEYIPKDKDTVITIDPYIRITD